MKDIGYLFCSLLFCILCTYTEAKIGEVQNLAITPKQYAERSQAVATWSVPTNLDGNAESEITYTVTYCQLNKADTCKTESGLKTTSFTFNVDKATPLYVVRVSAADKNGATGDEDEKTHIVPTTLTCEPSLFLCSTSKQQCVQNSRKCNGLVDCADGTDEKDGCPTPASKVKWTEGKALSDMSVEVTWSKSTNRADFTQSYQIQNVNTSATNNKNHPALQPNIVTLSQSVFGLAPFTTYMFRIRAVNRAGEGPWSDLLSVTTLAGQVGNVTNFKIEGKQYDELKKAVVSWSPPTVLNGNLIADLTYTVRYCQLNRQDTCQTMEDLKVTEFEFDVDLEKSLYEVRVFAVDKTKRQGAAVENSYRVPSVLTCEPGSFQCNFKQQCLSNPAMLCDGRVHCADGSDETKSANCAIPGPITGVKSTVLSPFKIKVEWNKGPQSDRLVNYEVIVIENNKTALTPHPNLDATTTVLSQEITDLLPNTEYTIQVRGINRAGEGPWTAATKQRTFEQVSEVQNITVTPKQYNELKEATVAWLVPTTLGQTPVNELTYVVEHCRLNLPDTCVQTNPVSGLTVNIVVDVDFSLYQLTVWAVETSGAIGKKASYITYKVPRELSCPDGHFQCSSKDQCLSNPQMLCDSYKQCLDGSDETTAANCPLPQSKVTWVKGEALSTSEIKVTWRKVVRLADITQEYQIENVNTTDKNVVDHPKLDGQTTQLDTTFASLLANKAYNFRVRSKNFAGYGEWSDLLTVTTPKGEQIGEVANLKHIPLLYEEGSGRQITWEAPPNDNGEDPSKFTYLVTYCELNTDKCKNETTNAGVTGYNITGLKIHFPYHFYVTPIDASGKAGVRDSAAFRTEMRDTCTSEEFRCVASPQCIRKVMTCDNRAQCADGSDETTAAGCAVPQNRPEIVNTVAEIKSIKLTWKKIDIQTGDRVSGYQAENLNQSGIYKEAPSYSNQPAVGEVSVTFDGLYSNQIYQFRVRAVNPSGNGAWSDVVTVETKKADAPGQVVNIVNEAVLYDESTKHRFSWDVPLDNNGEDPSTFTYLITYCKLNLPDCKSVNTTEKTIVITGLLRANLYLFSIRTAGANGKPGGLYQQPFKTDDRDTCQLDEFACQVTPQCVNKKMRCDGIVQCLDGSDETLAAECKLPRSTVTGIETKVTENSVEIMWDRITLQSDRIRFYRITNVNTDEIVEIEHKQYAPAVTKMSKTFTDLRSNREYKFKIQARNPSGLGQFSEITIMTTEKSSIGLAGPVTNVQHEPIATDESNAINITWNVPTDLKNNSASLLTYRVKYCANSDPCNKYTNYSGNTFAEIRGLAPTTNYAFSVFVYNENQEFDSSLVHAGDFTTLNIDTCSTSEWKCIGVLQCVPQDKKCDGQNDCSDGSDEFVEANCSLPPNVTDFKFISRTDDSITLEFSGIRDTNDRITSYKVQNYETNEAKTIAHESSKEKYRVIFTGLMFGKLYEFKVFAINLSGETVTGVSLMAHTNGMPTGHVVNFQETPTTNAETSSRTISWDPPSMLYENDVADLKYFATYCLLNMESTCKNSSVVDAPPLKIGSLSRGNLYQVAVHAVNKFNLYNMDFDYKPFKTEITMTCGTNYYRCKSQDQCVPEIYACDSHRQCADGSDEQIFSNCTLPDGKPSGLKVVQSSITKDVIEVEFLQNHAADRVRDYQVWLSDTKNLMNRTFVAKSKLGTGVPLKAEFQGLRGGTEYKIQVRARNDVGYGKWTDPIMVSTILEKPTETPTDTKKLSGTPNSVQIQFKHTLSDGAEQYELRLKKIGTNAFITQMINHTFDGSEEQTMLISGLEPETNYQVEVRAINSEGVGPWSEPIAVKTEKEDDDDGLSTGEIIGIIIACILIFIILVIIIVHVSKSRGKGNINKFQNGGPDPNAYGNSAYEMDHKY